MDWKDTVMKKKKISKVISESEEDNDEFWMPADATKLVAEAQAEISFPLGQQEGVRKVAEWLERYGWWSTDSIFGEYRIEEWEDYLKEWDITP